MGKDSHRDEHDQKIDENCRICKDSEFLQRPNLTDRKASDCPN